MDLRTRLKYKYTQEEADDQLVQLLRGESTKHTYDAHGNLVRREKVVNPKDAANGLILASALGLTDHGLAPSSVMKKDADKAMYDKFRPKVDRRIIALDAKPEQEAQPDPVDKMLEALKDS